MAEFTTFRNNALPYPIFGAPYVVTFPLLDADGDPISPSSPDSEISKNGDTFADCTNEVVEIATSSGICYLSLTGTELTTDCATIRIQSTGAKTTVLSLYPRKLVSIRAGTSASAGSSTSTIVLDASASAIDDFYNGMIVVAVIDSVTEVRMITDYTGSTQTAAVTPDWNTAPDNNDTFTVYLPDGVQIQQANVSHWNSLATVALPLTPTTAGRTLDVSTGGEAGVDWANVGSPTTVVGLSGTTIKTATDVETDTADIQSRLPAALVGGRIDSNVGAISSDATAADNAEAFFDGTGYAGTNNVIPLVTTTTTATNVTTVNGLAANVITAASIADGAIDTATFATGTTIPRCTLTDTLTTYTGNTPQTGDAYAIVNSGTHGNAAIKGYVDDIGTAGAGLTAVPWNAAWDAEVQSEVQDAIEVNHLDHLIGVADPGSIVANSSLWAALTSKSATPTYSTYNNTTDSHEALRDRGDSAWITATGFSTLDAAGVRSAVGLASANLDTQLDALPTAVEVRNAVTGGAYALSTDANGMVRIVDGTGIGELDTLSGTVLLRSATQSQINAIEADTNELQTDWTNGGRLDLLLDAILDDTGTSGVVVDAASKTGYALTASERNSIATAHLDLTDGIETNITVRQATRAIAAILDGIVSGAGTGTEVFKGIGQSSGGTTRVTVTVDGSGNRTAMTLNV